MFAAWRTTSAKECELCRSIERKKLHVQQINGHDDLFFIVHVAVQQQGKIMTERFGEAFFTAGGIGGPIILDMSADIRAALKRGEVQLLLDLQWSPQGDPLILAENNSNG